MSEEKETGQGGVSVSDIYYVLFRRKWIIIAFAVFGLAAAATLLAIKPALYRSQAVLYIKYVEESRGLAPPGTDLAARVLNDRESSILKAEARMMHSTEVARQVVNVIGAPRLMAPYGGGNDADQAADLVKNHLEIEMDPQSGGVISILFRHPDSRIPQAALREVIDGYMRKHKEMWMGMDSGFIDREIEHCRTELTNTEQQLREAKNKAGVVDVAESKKDYAKQIAEIRGELFRARGDLIKYEDALEEYPRLLSASSGSTNLEEVIGDEVQEEYRNLCARLETLNKDELALQAQGFTTNAALVKMKRRLIAEVRAAKKQLEDQHPRLANLPLASSGAAGASAMAFDPAGALVMARALRSQTNEWSDQLAQLQAELNRIDEWEGAIQNLERDKKSQEEKLDYYLARREQVRVEGEIGANKAPNIARIDPPTPAVKARSKSFIKKVQMVAAGGFMAGIGLAFLLELFLDRSVKRPVDVQKKVKLPLFISIPLTRLNGKHLLFRPGKRPALLNDAARSAETAAESEPKPSLPVAVWDRSHPLRRFYSGLRDRLITYFEVRDAHQKPKLVAVTSCGKGVGVSTIAAGLAASLSETGDGNVLLVDMNADQGASQQFYKGKPGCGLDDALGSETMDSAMVQSHLYVATEVVSGANLPSVLPRRFDTLVPKLKGSEYDYIIFDMPPVSPTSMTPRMARLMDMVLLVIESEKTSQDVVQQATTLLAESKANVSAVLNKTRSYVPSLLHQELSDV